MNYEENEVEEWEEPKLEEAVDIFRKYFKISFEAAGKEWTEKNDEEIEFALIQLVNTPIYEIVHAISESSCECEDENCDCNEE